MSQVHTILCLGWEVSNSNNCRFCYLKLHVNVGFVWETKGTGNYSVKIPRSLVFLIIEAR